MYLLYTVQHAYIGCQNDYVHFSNVFSRQLQLVTSISQTFYIREHISKTAISKLLSMRTQYKYV